MPVRQRASPTDGTTWLAAQVARAAGDADVRRRVIDGLQAAATAGTLIRGDRLLIIDLALMPEVRVPRDPLDALLPAALTDDSGAEDRRLADALAAQHHPAADGVAQWADALLESAANGGRTGTLLVEPNPIYTADDASTAGWLSAAFATDPVPAERALAAMRADRRVTPRSTHCELLWVRLAAERGDLDAFRSRLGEALRAFAWQRIVPRPGVAAAGGPVAPRRVRRSAGDHR